MWRNAANALGFQVVWACCVVYAARGMVWPGILAAAIFALAMLSFGGKPRDDLKALLLALPLGIALDSSLSMTGWLHYAQGVQGGLAPAWIGALWLAFAFTLNHSFSFLRERIGLAALLGFVCSPLSYLAAQRIGAVEFNAPLDLALPMVAIAWAMLLPLLFALLRASASSPRRDGHPA